MCVLCMYTLNLKVNTLIKYCLQNYLMKNVIFHSKINFSFLNCLTLDRIHISKIVKFSKFINILVGKFIIKPKQLISI